MVLLIKKLFLGYNKLLDLADPRVADLPLMHTPSAILCILGFYVIFIFKIGPKLMNQREPFAINGIIMTYNLLQILLNIIGFIWAVMCLPKANIFCTPIDKTTSTDAMHFLYLHYGYFILKVLDLLDTIFFVLRKKYNQITFLHLYHHIMVAGMGWVSLKFFPGGQLFFLGFLNVIVHIFMYFYYFLTSWDAKYKGSIWWKKHITQLQILQFCFIFVAFAIPLLNMNCNYPKLLLAAYLPQMTLMIFLFSDFYYKAYIRKTKTVKE